MKAALVLAAVRKRQILTYYQGDGEWGFEDNARIYFCRHDMNQGKREAKQHLPEAATAVEPFGVYVEE